MTIVTDPPQTAAADALTAGAARLDAAVAAIRGLDLDAQAVAQEFALALDALSRSALTTMVRRLKADPRGTELLYDLVDDPEVRLVLGMYGIIRLPDPEQADRASTGAGADGSAPEPARAPRAFISLDAMFRGPSPVEAHACGTEGAACGPESCVCGEH